MRIFSGLEIMSIIDKNKSYSRLTNYEDMIPRSQSDSSQNSLAMAISKRQRRGSDWSDTNSILPLSSDEDDEIDYRVVLRPLQVCGFENGDVESKNLSYRRFSKNLTKSSTSSNVRAEKSKSTEVSRSQSVKTAQKKVECRRRHRGSSIPSEVSSGGARVQERTISNRSLPLPGDESEYTRLRNFSVTSKRIINRGDSFRSKSSLYSGVYRCPHNLLISEKKEQSTGEVVKETVEFKDAVRNAPTHKVLIIGEPEVGKTSLKNQFMTSEYICGYDSAYEDDSDNYVTIVLNSEEAQLEFEEEALMDDMMSCYKVKNSRPHACVVLYSVTSRRSFQRVKQFLPNLLSLTEEHTSVILVGNKTDLARLRAVSTEEGRSLAKEMGCKFIETSVAINHQVDELLVGILTQIRMKKKHAEKQQKRRDSQSRKPVKSHGCKASGVLKRILQRACLKSKSCDNLHVL